MVKHVFETPHLGMQRISLGLPASSAAGRSTPWNIGDIVRAYDADAASKVTYEYIYLPGVASNTAGAAVTYSPTTYAVTLAGTPSATQLSAVSMAATVAGQFGWYKIARKTAVPAA